MPPRNSPQILALLALLTLVTLVARGYRVGSGLPHRSEPDAVLVWQAGGLDLQKRGLEPRHDAHVAKFYPLLIARVLDALPGNAAAVAAPADAPLEAHLAAAKWPYLRARLFVLLLSVLLVPATFFLARRFVEPPWALLAAGLVATSLLHTSLSQMARPHGVLTTACLLSVLAAYRLLERGSLNATLWNAGAAAIAVSVLHSGIFIVPTALAAAWFAPATARGVRIARVGLALLAISTSILVFYPDLIGQLGFTSIPGEGERLLVAGQDLPLSSYGPAGYLRIVPRWFAVDPMLVVLTGLGFIALVPLLRNQRELRRPLWIGALHPASTLLLFGLHPTVDTRFLLPVLPWLALLGVLGLRGILARGLTPARGALIASLVLLPPAGGVAYYLQHRASEDVHQRLARWLDEQRAGERMTVVAPYGISIPAWMDPARWQRGTRMMWSPWIAYQVQVLADAPPPAESLDVIPWVPSKAVPDVSSLLHRLLHMPPGVLVVRRPSRERMAEVFADAVPRERLVEVLGEPLLVLDPARDLSGPFGRLLHRSVPQDFASILDRRYPGPGYEVYALPRGLR